MSFSISPSSTETHTNGSSYPRQEHEHPSYRGDRNLDLHGYHPPFRFHPISACLPFRITLILMNLSHPLSLTLAQGHAYILYILILVGVECHFTLMYAHVLWLLCFLCLAPCPHRVISQP